MGRKPRYVSRGNDRLVTRERPVTPNAMAEHFETLMAKRFTQLDDVLTRLKAGKK